MMETQNMYVSLHGSCVSACGCGRGGGTTGGGGCDGHVRNGATPETVVFNPGMAGGDGVIEIHTR